MIKIAFLTEQQNRSGGSEREGVDLRRALSPKKKYLTGRRE